MPDRLMMLHMVAMRSGGVSSNLQGRLFAASSIVEPSTRKTGSPSRCRQLDDSHLLSKNDRPLGMCEPLSGTRSDMVKRTSRRRSFNDFQSGIVIALKGASGSNPSALSLIFVSSCRRSCRAGLVNCNRSEEHTSELQSLMRITYAVF